MKLSEREKKDLIELTKDLINHGFGQAINADTSGPRGLFDHYIYTWIDENQIYLNRKNIVISCGMTRVVVIPESGKWVLKFNFNDTREDYNLLETINYERACKENLEQYFAAMYFVDSIDGIKVYAQERVRTDVDEISDRFFEYTLENFYGDYEGDDEEEIRESAWEESTELENDDRIYAMIEGRDADELIEFCNHYDINDLHDGNWGYRKTEPVIIDYAGF